MTDNTDTAADTDDWPGYTPEEMHLPTDLVERIKLVCSLLDLPVAERSGGTGIVLDRVETWRAEEPADHVTVRWSISDTLLDAYEAQRIDGPASQLCAATDGLEEALVNALRLGGLRVERDSDTREWNVVAIVGPSPLP